MANRIALSFSILLSLGLLAACSGTPYTPIVSPSQPVDVAAYIPKVDSFIVVLDTSSSMAESEEGRSRLHLAQDFVATFNSAVPPGKFQAGLVSFGNDSGICFGGGSASQKYGMTAYNSADFAGALGSIKCAGGTTPMSKGINAARKMLDSQSGPVAVIIVSDFQRIDAPSVTAAVAELRVQHRDNVCIHTVKVGNAANSGGLIASITDGAGCDSSVNAADIDPSSGMTAYVTDTLMAPLQYEKHTISATTLFDFDKSVLKEQGKAQLRILADKIKSQGANIGDIDVVGYTDSIGTVQYNQKLSVRRAAAVKAYLVSAGIDAKIIDVIGKGESDPVATNMYKDGRAKNRRVEINVGTPRPVK
jgi:OOP family OmpA-OmpF porin